MSAVIVSFPLNKQHSGERLRAVLEAVVERAKSTHATDDQRRKARAEAMDFLQRGGSVGAAIQEGYKHLPSVRQPAYRQPTFPRTPDAA